jgi:integrase/recombinase XerC
MIDKYAVLRVRHPRTNDLVEVSSPGCSRHAFATQILGSYGNLHSIQELLGHVSLSTTQRYAAVDAQRLLAAYAEAHPRA